MSAVSFVRGQMVGIITDASMRTNPRIPLLGELVELLIAGYEGRAEA